MTPPTLWLRHTTFIFLLSLTGSLASVSATAAPETETYGETDNIIDRKKLKVLFDDLNHDARNDNYTGLNYLYFSHGKKNPHSLLQELTRSPNTSSPSGWQPKATLKNKLVSADSEEWKAISKRYSIKAESPLVFLTFLLENHFSLGEKSQTTASVLEALLLGAYEQHIHGGANRLYIAAMEILAGETVFSTHLKYYDQTIKGIVQANSDPKTHCSCKTRPYSAKSVSYSTRMISNARTLGAFTLAGMVILSRTMAVSGDGGRGDDPTDLSSLNNSYIQCQSELTSGIQYLKECQTNMIMQNDNLAQCNYRYNTAKESLATQSQELQSCNYELSQVQGGYNASMNGTYSSDNQTDSSLLGIDSRIGLDQPYMDAFKYGAGFVGGVITTLIIGSSIWACCKQCKSKNSKRSFTRGQRETSEF